jgi:hypothetical protein
MTEHEFDFGGMRRRGAGNFDAARLGACREDARQVNMGSEETVYGCK